MKEFKGTGGNWILKQQGDANEFCIVTDDMKWVSAFKLNGEQSEKTQLANMNLFATAPELLAKLDDSTEILKSLLGLFGDSMAMTTKFGVSQQIKENEKIINKALRINGNTTEEA